MDKAFRYSKVPIFREHLPLDRITSRLNTQDTNHLSLSSDLIVQFLIGRRRGGGRAQLLNGLSNLRELLARHMRRWARHRVDGAHERVGVR